jgi:hypothetical protein
MNPDSFRHQKSEVELFFDEVEDWMDAEIKDNEVMFVAHCFYDGLSARDTALKIMEE